MDLPHNGLTPAQLAEIREMLERTLRKLERNIRVSANGRAHDLDQSSVGRLSRIETLQNQGLAQSLQERERTQFEEVVQALGRLDAGTYGLCTSCRHPISPERLLIFPETRSCGDCPRGN